MTTENKSVSLSSTLLTSPLALYWAGVPPRHLIPEVQTK